MSQRGNVLFLILIAVALLAALSYAVTSSTRGGGKDISDEDAQLAASQIQQMIVGMRMTYTRLKVSGEYDQIQFGTNAATNNGTCYFGTSTVTPCKSIGLYHSSNQLPLPVFPEKWADLRYYPPTAAWMNQYWSWRIARVVINGVDVGSSAPDVFVTVQTLSEPICKAINKTLNGSTTIGIRSFSGATTYPYRYYNIAAFSGQYVNQNEEIDLANEGCTVNAPPYPLYWATFIIEEK